MSLSTISYKAVRNSRGVASGVAVLTVSFAVAAVVMAVSIASGFRDSLTGTLLAGEGDYWLECRDQSLMSVQTSVVDSQLIRRLYEHGAVKVEPRLSASVVILGEEGIQPMEIRSKSGIGGLSVSRNVREKYGDTLDVIYSMKMPFAFPVPVDSVFICGIRELSSAVGYAPQATVSKFRGLGTDAVDGYAVWGGDMESVCAAVLDDPIWVYDSKERFAGIYDWLDVIDGNVWLVVLVMMAVSAVNMVAATLSTVLENVRTVAVLKSLGMPMAGIRRGFMMKTLLISSIGAAAGLSIALVLSYVQSRFAVIQLPEEDYMLSSVPVSISVAADIAVAVGSIVVITLSSIAATVPLDRIRESRALRYE